MSDVGWWGEVRVDGQFEEMVARKKIWIVGIRRGREVE